MEIDEIKTALEGGMIKENGEIDGALGDAIIAQAKSLAREILSLKSDLNTDRDRFNPLYEFSKNLELISWCFPISTKKVATSRVNRLMSMFCGPFFTSDEFPWPEIEGRYAEPMVQLNLEEIQSISPVKVGSGMLQLWGGEWGTDDVIIRVIPRSELEKENISSVPECIDSEYYGELRWVDGWPELDYKKKVPCSHEIMPIDAKRIFYWPLGLEDIFLAVEGKIEDVNILEKVKIFSSIFPYYSPSTEPHLFGSFNPIQYDPIDASSTFLALEGRPCFGFNDGNAQISYRINDSGEIEFGFAWSCQ